MTFQHFNALSSIAQQDLVYNEGVWLMERLTGSFLIVLYQIEGFYVEIYYLRSTYEVIVIKSFTNTDLLHPYLSKINVSELVGFT